MEKRQYNNLYDEIKNILFKITFAPAFRRINSVKIVNTSGVMPKRIVICGSPRSGTTLMNELMRCFSGLYVMNREEHALRFPYLVFNKEYIVTKHPLDFYHFNEIIDKLNDPVIIFMLRDPRDVVVSKHFKNKNHYLVEFPLWESAINSYELLNYDKKILINYEELVRDPLAIQKLLADKLGLEVASSFTDFYLSVDKRHKDIKSLGGVRPIDQGNIGKYANDEHHERIKEQISSYPIMSDYLIKYGFENDREWEGRYVS